MPDSDRVTSRGVRWKPRGNLLTRATGDDLLILDRVANRVHHLNRTAGFVWSECDGTKSAADIAADVAARYGAQPQTVLEDVVGVLAELEQLGLLERDVESHSEGNGT